MNNRFKDREVLQAVHDEQLVKFLQNINVYDRIITGDCKCKFCKKTISIDNIHMVFPESKQVKFVCDNLSCVAQMSSYLTDK